MNKNLKKRIIDSFTRKTPDLRSQIIERCSSEDQFLLSEENIVKTQTKKFNFKRFALVCSFVALFTVGIIGGSFLMIRNQRSEVETFVFLESLASVGIVLNEENQVISCTPMNENAKNIVQSNNFIGLDISVALDSLITSMSEKGYIDDQENSLLVSVVNKDATHNSQILNFIDAQIKSVLTHSNIRCAVIVQTVVPNEELAQRAKEQGISIGKMCLIDKMMQDLAADEAESEDMLANLSIRELSFIYSTRRPNGSSDIVSGNFDEYISEETAINKILTKIGYSLNQISIMSIKVRTSKRDDISIVYLIKLEINADANASQHEFEVDCITGEVNPADNIGYSTR